ncbi:MAG: hypothetical protein KDA90_23080, partial [Planctomycetaceae bacterium]|nr:hypothetical protein [Planctomycetaceae bacterium]
HGYLKSLLDALEISPESQVLVFSQTSFQLRKISPSRPRAVYFNDDTYIGWVQGGDVIEMSTSDPQLGGVFYTLPQQEKTSITFTRDRGQCLTCHASSRTRGVPGHLVRSIFPNDLGQPLLASGTFTTDHTSPFSERWGGWYVTGTHGSMRHMGNVMIDEGEDSATLNREQGANCKSLQHLIRTEPYLTPHSDLVALMVLEHQTQMHNALTLASMETRIARHYDGMMNEALGREPDYQSESTGRRIQSVCDKLLRGLLFAGEFKLEAPITGTSGFQEEFATRGPVDSQGRSLRQFDLKTRMFKYPCSYLIYSDAFIQLPDDVRDYTLHRLHEVLTGADTSEEFAHLSAADRQAIREILMDTLPGLPEEWRK